MSDQTQKIITGDKIFFSWSFFALKNENKDQRWYVVFGLAILILLITAIATKNILFAILIVLVGLTILLLHRNNQNVTVTFFSEGIVINGVAYAYENMKNFFIVYEPPTVKKLFFVPKSLWRQRITVELEDQNPADIRQFLLERLEEDEDRKGEPISERFGRILKL